MRNDTAAASLAELTEPQRQQAMARFAVLRPTLEEGVPLIRAAADADVPLRTVRRWLTRFRRDGLMGLARASRCDVGRRRLPADLVSLIEGMGLRRPRSSVAAIHRRVAAVAEAKGWPAPSYSTTCAILARLDPAMVSLALDGPAVFRERYELIYRHRASAPNALWQADHTLLDILVLDEGGRQVRPWLTTVIDDHSRAVAGTMLFLGAPSALNTSLALRHAIWRKADAAWPVCGIPDVLYVDHGSDFTSRHLDQVAASLHMQIVHSGVARPQGRGKIERLFGTINTELLPELPGHLVAGAPVSPPALSLADLDRATVAFIRDTYHRRTHGEIGQTPLDAWRANGFLPRLPDSLEALDLLLVMVAKPRCVRRDGIHFQGLRYVASTLAAYVGETVTIRYDPRDVSEIRVFHRERFLCRAVNEEHAGEALSLKDVEAARRLHRRTLRRAINERVTRISDFLPDPSPRTRQITSIPSTSRPKLRVYEVEDEG